MIKPNDKAKQMLLDQHEGLIEAMEKQASSCRTSAELIYCSHLDFQRRSIWPILKRLLSGSYKTLQNEEL